MAGCRSQLVLLSALVIDSHDAEFLSSGGSGLSLSSNFHTIEWGFCMFERVMRLWSSDGPRRGTYAGLAGTILRRRNLL